MAVPGRADADALPAIVAGSPLPVIADIHFNASLALRAIDAGVAAVRINPGNIGGDDKVEQVVTAAKAAGIPMRIGANSGSLPDHLRQFATNDPAGALVEAALEEVRLLERLGYHDFKISVKSSSVPVMIDAYRRLADKVPYPLHLGVTEAGPVVHRHGQELDRHRQPARRRASATPCGCRSPPTRSRRSRSPGRSCACSACATRARS